MNYIVLFYLSFSSIQLFSCFPFLFLHSPIQYDSIWKYGILNRLGCIRFKLIVSNVLKQLPMHPTWISNCNQIMVDLLLIKKILSISKCPTCVHILSIEMFWISKVKMKCNTNWIWMKVYFHYSIPTHWWHQLWQKNNEKWTIRTKMSRTKNKKIALNEFISFSLFLSPLFISSTKENILTSAIFRSFLDLELHPIDNQNCLFNFYKTNLEQNTTT